MRKSMIALIALAVAAVSAPLFAQVTPVLPPERFTAGQYPGTATNDDALAGNLGFAVYTALAKGSAISLTTGTAVNVITQSFGAGDWEISGTVCFTGNAATTVSSIAAGITPTTATIPTVPGSASTSVANIIYSNAAIFASASDNCIPITPVRQILSGSTNMFLVSAAAFGVNSMSTYGAIHGRRAR